jgi:FixJ family two-component response regulator
VLIGLFVESVQRQSEQRRDTLAQLRAARAELDAAARETVQLVREGAGNREIAAALSISEATVPRPWSPRWSAACWSCEARRRRSGALSYSGRRQSSLGWKLRRCAVEE